MIDLAIASGKTALANVVSTDSNRNLIIKLGLRVRDDGIELDFKPYTPQGIPDEIAVVKYQPSPQKLALFQGTTIKDIEKYAE